MTTVSDALDVLRKEPNIGDLVAAYFRDDGPFAGHLFDEVGDNPPDVITPSDLLAVSFLDVTYGPSAARKLLDSAETWSALLGAIDETMPIWELDATTYAAADTLWKRLIALPDVGPAKAGKLLARKRPHLIPIYDSVIGMFLSVTETGLWEGLKDALQDAERRRYFEGLGTDLRPRPSTLRLVDVAIWMRCGNSGNARQARMDVGLSEAPLVL